MPSKGIPWRLGMSRDPAIRKGKMQRLTRDTAIKIIAGLINHDH
jgi:hypothetical protein